MYIYICIKNVDIIHNNLYFSTVSSKMFQECSRKCQHYSKQYILILVLLLNKVLIFFCWEYPKNIFLNNVNIFENVFELQSWKCVLTLFSTIHFEKMYFDHKGRGALEQGTEPSNAHMGPCGGQYLCWSDVVVVHRMGLFFYARWFFFFTFRVNGTLPCDVELKYFLCPVWMSIVVVLLVVLECLPNVYPWCLRGFVCGCLFNITIRVILVFLFFW